MATDAWGIDDSYHDAFGGFHETAPAVRARIVRAMGGDPDGQPPRVDGPIVVRTGERQRRFHGELQLEAGGVVRVDGLLPPDLPAGYHRFVPADARPRRLIVAPPTAFLPLQLRRWGWSLQLPAVRSHTSWGMGDLEDLRRLAVWSRGLGAGLLLVNPICAAMPLADQNPSPYFPSSRLYRNPLYLRPEVMSGASDLPSDLLERLGAAARALNRERRIDRAAVFRLKLEALQALFERFSRDPSFDAYRDREGESLERFAIFCALAERYGGGWRGWPGVYRNPASSAVMHFAGQAAPRLAFHRWLQWQLEVQLDRAAAEMTVMLDLPIGVDPQGADAWAWQDLLARDVSVGAPPDELQRAGQDWGLPPFVPSALRAANYEPFIQTLRASLRPGGALRIDHVMGLFRLYWIPRGSSPAEGAYVRLPADDLLAILALESHRAGAFVCGEDLGTVEPGVRERLAREHILSYKVMYFEPRPPTRYPGLALASVGTHDLPTIAGLWDGSDLAAQAAIGLHPNYEGFAEMLHRLRVNGGLHESTPVEDVIEATHRVLGASPAAVALASLDDALAVRERPNMPGTVDEWPNWSLALPVSLEAIETEPLVARVAAALAETRPPP